MIAKGESFRAMKLLDRALAYRPDDEAVLELVVAASEAAPAPASGIITKRGLPPMSIEGFVSWVEQRMTEGVPNIPSAPPPKPGSGGGVAIWAVLLGLFGLLLMLAIIAAAILGAMI